MGPISSEINGCCAQDEHSSTLRLPLDFELPNETICVQPQIRRFHERTPLLCEEGACPERAKCNAVCMEDLATSVQSIELRARRHRAASNLPVTPGVRPPYMPCVLVIPGIRVLCPVSISTVKVVTLCHELAPTIVARTERKRRRVTYDEVETMRTKYALGAGACNCQAGYVYCSKGTTTTTTTTSDALLFGPSSQALFALRQHWYSLPFLQTHEVPLHGTSAFGRLFSAFYTRLPTPCGSPCGGACSERRHVATSGRAGHALVLFVSDSIPIALNLGAHGRPPCGRCPHTIITLPLPSLLHRLPLLALLPV